MPAKTATKTANVCVNIYEGEFQLNFDCVGEQLCRYTLCHVMPPDDSEECTFREHGSCLCKAAKYAAIEHLMKKLSKELKQMAEELEV